MEGLEEVAGGVAAVGDLGFLGVGELGGGLAGVVGVVVGEDEERVVAEAVSAAAAVGVGGVVGFFGQEDAAFDGAADGYILAALI